MSSFKKAKVVMLPTNKKAILFLKDGLLQSFNRVDESFITYNLYIISDDEIEEGDWFIYNNKLLKCTGFKNSYILVENSNYTYFPENSKKIIITTDTSLNTSNINNDTKVIIMYPQPSQQFIEKYIESYNKGEIITDVLVELLSEESYGCDLAYYGLSEPELKVNPKNNTIIIKEIKDTWNREELIPLLHQIVNDSHCLSNRVKFPSSNNCAEFTNNWIKENL